MDITKFRRACAGRPHPYRDGGWPAEYGTGMKLAIERGWLWLRESGTYLKFTDAGAALFA
jgi:hypothetical protein